MQAGAAQPPATEPVPEQRAPQRTQSQRAWWAELGQVVPRALAGAAHAAHPGPEADCPPLSANPLTWATLAVDELTMSTAYLINRRGGTVQDTLDDTREALRRLDEAGLLDDPAKLFPEPVAPKDLRTTRRRRAGVEFEHLSFRTPDPLPVALPGSVAWNDGNATAHAYLLRHGDRPRPWVVVLHGHRMGEPRDLRLLGSHRLPARSASTSPIWCSPCTGRAAGVGTTRSRAWTR